MKFKLIGEKYILKAVTMPVSDDDIIANYSLPGHPTAFSAPHNVAKFYGIPIDRARTVLEHIDSFGLHREYKRPRVYNPYFIYKKRDLVQADLIDIRELSKANDGVNHLLLIIDVFTRFVWVYPITNKRATTVRDALREWLESLRMKPRVFSTDRGGEFFNGQVRALFRSFDVEQQEAVGTSKASYAERANKSIQILLYKYMTDKQTERYLDALPLLVRTYNSRGHRSLKFMSPAEAEQPRNQREVLRIAKARFAKVKTRQAKLKVGDRVRIKKDAKVITPARRAYAQQFKSEYFRIREINTKLPIPLYYLESDDDNEIIIGGFYREELQLIRGDTFKIDRVIKWRKKKDGTREALVKWKYYGNRWNSWVPENQITNIGSR